MSRETRLEKLRRLEEVHRMPVIAYVTSTRENAEAQMGMDAIRFLYEHLRLIKEEPETIALFIHSNGGEGTVPWKLVTLIREYCESFHVLVPYRAFSAATLTALGADKIYMHPMGMLGPTDPSIRGPFNPRDPDNAKNILPISVEEVLAYIALVKEDVGIQHEEELVQAFNKLADQVHPIALGAVKRTHAQSRMIAGKLMGLIAPKVEDHRIEEIVSNLTSKLYYHGHPINRDEAKQLGLQVETPTVELEIAMWDLYVEYENDMRLVEPFRIADMFMKLAPDLQPGQGSLIDLPKMHAVMIESRGRCDAFTASQQIFGTKNEQGAVSTNLYTNRLEWERLDEPEAVPDEPEAVPDEPEAVPDEPEAVPDEPEVVPDEPEVVPDEPTV